MPTSIIASQAGAGYYPENTLHAATRSLADKSAASQIDGIELDFHLTLDGHFVAHHDYALHPDLCRDTTGEYLTRPTPIIKDLTLTTLKQYNLGQVRENTKIARHYPERENVEFEAIASFDDIAAALMLEENQSKTLWFEAKTNPYALHLSCATEQYGQALIEVLKDHPLLPKIVVIAFDWVLLRQLNAAIPSLKTGYLSIDFAWMSKTPSYKPGSQWLAKQPIASKDEKWFGDFNPNHYGGSFSEAVKAAGGTYWSPYFRDLDQQCLRQSQANGQAVSTWGADTEAELAGVAAMEFDSITTGYVRRLKR